MKIGRLNRRISLVKKVAVGKDSFGGEINELETIKTIWASVEPLGSMNTRDKLSAMQIYEGSNTKFTIRYLKEVDTTMLISYNGKLYDIKSVVNDYGKNIKLFLMCKEQEDGRI